MYLKKEIGEMIINNQNNLIDSILSEINEISKLDHLDNIEKLDEISNLIEEFNRIKKEIITEYDIEKYIDDELIECANIKAIAYVEDEGIPEYMKKYHKEGFLIGYIGEHIRIYKRLEHIKEVKKILK